MKKIKTIIVALLLCALIIPFSANAEEETSDSSKVNVYLFRGEGCGFCASALSFFDSIEEEYGKYYNLITYEVWNDVENAELLNQVAEYLDTTINGVPFIIIGDKTYPGFQESWGEEIKQDIINEYNKSVEERTDIIENVKNGIEPEKSSTDAVISLISLALVAGIIAFIVVARKGNSDEKKEKTNIDETKLDEEEIIEEKIEKKARKITASKSNSKSSSTKTSTTKKNNTNNKETTKTSNKNKKNAKKNTK